MGPLTLTLVVLAAVASIAIAVAAVRRPILFRMAARNATRRPRQTATVIAGLMIGTAIISSALVAGDSAGSAIRGAVYNALGHVDETMEMDGYTYFPEAVYDDLLADPAVAGHFDAIAPNVIWEGAAEDPATGLFEPRVALVGFDPVADAGFGDFELTDGTRNDGRFLSPGETVLTERLATALDVGVGATIEMTFTPPVDPVLPQITALNGTVPVGAAVATGVLDGLPGAPAPTPAPVPTRPEPIFVHHDVEVPVGATGMVIVVGWPPSLGPGIPPTQQLHVTATSPDGEQYVTEAPPPGTVTMPLWLNVTGEPTLAEGTWDIAIGGSVAANAPYRGAAVVLTPVYDLQQLLERSQSAMGAAEDLGFDPDDFRFAEPVTVSLDVVGVTNGGRGSQFDFHEAAFVHWRQAQEVLGVEGRVNIIKFSNPGGIVAGGIDAAADEALLESALARVQAQYDAPAVAHIQVKALKTEFLQVADQAGQLMTSLLLFAGGLSIMSGLLLIINIFTMLAEERRSELGMARAVGLHQRDLVRLFLFEGSLYAVAAAAIGAVLGLGLAAVMVWGLNVFLASQGSIDGFPPIDLVARPIAILGAFAAGALLTFVTILAASRRIARLNIVRAIRRIDEPEKAGGILGVIVGAPVTALAAIATALGWIFGQFTLQVLGPLAMVVGLSLLLRRNLARRRRNPLLAAALALYYAATYFAITEYNNIEEANIIGPVRGVLMTLSLVVLVVHWERGTRFIGRAMMRVRRLAPIAIPAVSYPLHRRFRTGMTLAIFSVVILAIGFFSIFGALFETDPAAQTGGFHIEGRTTLEVPDLGDHDAGLVPDGVVLARHHVIDYDSFFPGFITVSGERTGQFGPPQHHVYGIDADFIADQELRLLWRLPEYADDDAAYRALLERDDVIIVAYQYSTNEANQDLSHDVGETLQIHLGDDVREYTIIGIQEQYHFPGVWLPKTTVQDLFTNLDSVYVWRLADGVDHEATARLLEQNHRSAGLDAFALEARIAEEQEGFRQILGAMKLFLGLGLIVGVLSLGIVTSRSVLERRQEIGMLRALGYTIRQVRRIFLLEVLGTVIVGTVVGFAASVLVTYGLWYAIIRELQYPYIIPWSEVALLFLVSTLVALAATVLPVLRAGRTPPAEALRYIE